MVPAASVLEDLTTLARRPFAGLSAAPAFGAHSNFGYLRRLRVNFPRAASDFTTARLPPPMDIEVGGLGHAQSLFSPTRLSSTRHLARALDATGHFYIHLVDHSAMGAPA